MRHDRFIISSVAVTAISVAAVWFGTKRRRLSTLPLSRERSRPRRRLK